MRILAAFALAAAAAMPAAAQDKTIVDVAAGNDQFSTLVTAVKAAGLAETLSGEGPFTVLAPTNEAFEKLPEGTLEMLLKPENKEKLAGILMLHVIEGKVTASQVKQLDGETCETCCPEGNTLEVMASDGSVKFKSGDSTATVVKPDIMADNGVIHAIDTVLLPPAA